MANRRTLCTQCNGVLEFAAEAKSVNCRHCNTRVVTEAMDVAEYVAVRRFATANRMRITKKGRVYASVRADELEIDGFLQGDATALVGIRLTKNARVNANLRASFLHIEPGAILVGNVQIGPAQVPEIEKLAPAPAAATAGATSAARP